MMALGEILAARANNARARGTIEVGALGTVTIEALPVRELERLWYGIDRDRVVFYAACRELQREGAALLRAGKVYRPDQVMALISDAEAAKAAEAVRALSGWPETDGGTAAIRPDGNADGDSTGEAADMVASSDDAALDTRTAAPRAEGERLDDVDEQISHEAEIRPATVRENAAASDEIRRSSAQNKMNIGQISHELLTERKTQVLPENAADVPQNVRASDSPGVGLLESGADFSEKSDRFELAKTAALHESGPEPEMEMRESKSESEKNQREITSKSAEKLHKGEPDFGGGAGDGGHETTSELAERVARELLEGFRRAAWVR